MECSVIAALEPHAFAASQFCASLIMTLTSDACFILSPVTSATYASAEFPRAVFLGWGLQVSPGAASLAPTMNSRPSGALHQFMLWPGNSGREPRILM